jgi:hypothetical protein
VDHGWIDDHHIVVDPLSGNPPVARYSHSEGDNVEECPFAWTVVVVVVVVVEIYYVQDLIPFAAEQKVIFA